MADAASGAAKSRIAEPRTATEDTSSLFIISHESTAVGRGLTVAAIVILAPLPHIAIAIHHSGVGLKPRTFSPQLASNAALHAVQCTAEQP
ncbi:MAG: hypothetical protein HLUCCA11_18880, partial [Phormidesmis priestleyi Ana]